MSIDDFKSRPPKVEMPGFPKPKGSNQESNGMRKHDLTEVYLPPGSKKKQKFLNNHANGSEGNGDIIDENILKGEKLPLKTNPELTEIAKKKVTKILKKAKKNMKN